MILNVRRSSGFPLILEDSQLATLDVLEQEGLYSQLEDYERELRHSDELKEVKIEATKLEEVLMFLNSLNHNGPITIDFRRSLVVIEDNGDADACN